MIKWLMAQSTMNKLARCLYSHLRLLVIGIYKNKIVHTRPVLIGACAFSVG